MEVIRTRCGVEEVVAAVSSSEAALEVIAVDTAAGTAEATAEGIEADSVE